MYLRIATNKANSDSDNSCHSDKLDGWISPRHFKLFGAEPNVEQCWAGDFGSDWL